MVLINLDALSDSELRCIAQQEHLENWETADRADLIEDLQEKYEDDDVDIKDVSTSANSARRFCTSLTDFGSMPKINDQLPGVEELPKNYNETSIHLLMRDPQWAYAYWSISPLNRGEIIGDGSKDPELFLRVEMWPVEKGEESFFDIAVSIDDEQWNINLPEIGYRYQVKLAVKQDGGYRILACSKTIVTYESYWESHYDEIAMNSDLFSVQFSSVVTREGEVASNPILRSVAKVLSKGVIA